MFKLVPCVQAQYKVCVSALDEGIALLGFVTNLIEELTAILYFSPHQQPIFYYHSNNGNNNLLW